MSAVASNEVGANWRALVGKYGWILAAIAALILLILRAPDAFYQPQFWAEDGTVYFVQQRELGLWALANPYHGALYVGPRIVAHLVAPFGAVAAPTLYNAAAILGACWAAATIASTSFRYAVLFGVTYLAAPSDGVVFGGLTHVQWLLAPALAMIAITPSPDSSAARINQLLLAVVAGLSGPFAIFVAPIVLCRLIRSRDAHSVVLAGIVFTAAALQFSLGVLAYKPFEGARDPVPMAIAMVDRVFGMLAHGWRSESLQDVLLATAFAGLVFSVFAVRRDRPMFLWLAYFAAAIMGSGWVRFMPGHSFYFNHPVEGDRYFYFAKLLCIWALIYIVLEGRRFHKAAAVAGLALVIANFTWWQRTPLPYKPWKEVAWKIDRGEAVSIPIQPEGWAVTLGRPER